MLQNILPESPQASLQVEESLFGGGGGGKGEGSTICLYRPDRVEGNIKFISAMDF